MASSVRLMIALLLCCVTGFGHAPAWLHVATCHSAGHGVAHIDQPLRASGCCSHSVPCTQTAVPSPPSNEADHHQHDSSDCLACQSLACPCGVTWAMESPRAVIAVCEVAFPLADGLVVPAILSLPQLRGPPV